MESLAAMTRTGRAANEGAGDKETAGSDECELVHPHRDHPGWQLIETDAERQSGACRGADEGTQQEKGFRERRCAHTPKLSNHPTKLACCCPECDTGHRDEREIFGPKHVEANPFQKHAAQNVHEVAYGVHRRHPLE